MEFPLYVRIRGQVKGPLDEDQIRRLIKRGQFGRLHEVSADGQNWSRASEFPELFVVDSRTVETGSTDAVTETVRSDSPAPTPAGGADGWYYGTGNESNGPIDRAALDHLIRLGTVSSSTLVWRQGFADWRPAGEVVDLAVELSAFRSAHPVSAPVGVAQSGQTSESSVFSIRNIRSLDSMRPWLRFCAIVHFLFVVSASFVGLTSLGMAVNNSSGILAIYALFYAGIAATWAWTGVILLQASGFSDRAVRERSETEFEAMLDSLRKYWTVLGATYAVTFVAILVMGISSVVVGVDEVIPN